MNFIDRLPKSYNELKFTKYLQIINTIPATKPDDYTDDDWNEYVHLTILSILLEASVEAIRACKPTEVIEMIKGITYLNEVPKPSKTKLKTIDISKVTYDQFVTYQKLSSNPFNNFVDILSILLPDTSKEEIQNLSVQEVTDCLKKLNTSLLKSYNSSIISLSLKMLKQTAKRKVMNLFKRPGKKS